MSELLRLPGIRGCTALVNVVAEIGGVPATVVYAEPSPGMPASTRWTSMSRAASPVPAKFQLFWPRTVWQPTWWQSTSS